ncbi:unnamed protein product [Jaminaea pallidilutea]
MSGPELTPARAISLIKTAYTRAPATVGTVASLLASLLANKAWESYRLYIALGPGGLFPHNLLGWLAHTLFLVPLGLSQASRRSATLFLPPQPSGGHEPQLLSAKPLKIREGSRPFVAGVAPHRCLNQRVEGDVAKRIPSHLATLAASHPTLLSQNPSLLEARDSPALFHLPASSSSRASPLSLYYLSLTPKREFAHCHPIDGSCHVILSPSDAAEVISKQWGELHPLAGFGLRGWFWPPFVAAPYLNWLVGIGPRSAQATRWGKYPPVLTRSIQAGTAMSAAAAAGENASKVPRLPPTYVLIYPPRDDAEADEVQRIIDAAVGFAVGFDVGSYHVDAKMAATSV